MHVCSLISGCFKNNIKKEGKWLGNSSVLTGGNAMLGCRYIYLGLFDSEVEAARLFILDSAPFIYANQKKSFFSLSCLLISKGLSTNSILVSVVIVSKSRAYDKAAIKCNGREAVTNFEPSTYDGELLTEVSAEGSSAFITSLFFAYNLQMMFVISWSVDELVWINWTEVLLAKLLEFGFLLLQLPMLIWTWAYLNRHLRARKEIRAPRVCSSTMDRLRAPNWKEQRQVLTLPWQASKSVNFSSRILVATWCTMHTIDN